MSSARLGAFAQRLARAISQGEVAVAHEGDNFRNIKVNPRAARCNSFRCMRLVIYFLT